MWRLDELFARFGNRFVYHVELKGKAAGLPAAVLRLIRKYALMDSCIVTSFSYESLQAMAALDDQIRLGWLIQAVDDAAVERGRALALFQLCPAAAGVTEPSVAQARAAFAEVRAWGLLGTTVSRQSAEVIALIHRVLEARCDGMTINWPDWVSHA
jgi:glycerophosphoryl diester phosphodiesterase